MFNVVFTDEGRALIAEIASNIDYSLLIFDVQFSDHDYTGQEATVTEATFTGDFASGTKTISVVDSTTMRIEAYFNNRYINDQKDLYSIGIFAKCVKPNGMIYTEIDSGLLAVCTVSTPRIIPPYVDAPFSVFSYNINLAVGSADNVTVVETQAGVQYKELATPLTINDTQETTVEGALEGLNDYGNALADNLAANENVYGAKNLNSYPYYGNKVENGITWTVNSDGSVTVSGIATGTAYIELHNRLPEIPNTCILKAGTYILSGGISSKVSINIDQRDSGGSCAPIGTDLGSGLTFTIVSDVEFTNAARIGLTLVVDSGTDLSTPVTIYPMIRDARVIDPTFAPYAETNLQLTQNKAERNDLSTIRATGSTNTTGAQIDAGTFFYLNGSFCKALTNIAVNATFTLNTNFEVATVGGELENKLNLVKVAESASGTDTYKNKLNALYSAFNGLSELEKINSFIASYGGGIAPMKLTFSYDKRFAYSSRQAANLLSELYITLDSSDSVLCEAILNSSTNEISINDQSSNNTSRTLYLYTLR